MTITSIFQIAYPDIQISQLSDLLYVRRIYSHIHLILLFDLPFFHLDLSMEPSLEDELRLANLSVHYADKYKWNIALVGPGILLKILKLISIKDFVLYNNLDSEFFEPTLFPLYYLPDDSKFSNFQSSVKSMSLQLFAQSMIAGTYY
jgi:hypothetical protein